MMESEIAPFDEELQSLAHLVTRQHAIVLCCAHSVAELVEEVARNLRGLGFDVDVVCGAEARSALLGRNDRRDEPTIYVVCVQGTLKEQVLKPLRQALATHGGPNQHLFVAVLDLALPLAMVGQIRRFAEALERPAGKGHGGINERRQWREQLGPNGSDRVPTRAYRAVDVLERTGAHATVEAGAAPRTGPQTVIGSARPAKVGVTAKYRAVTGQLPAVGTEPEPASEPANRRRRRTHAPKVRVKPVAPVRGRRARSGEHEAAGEILTDAPREGDAPPPEDAEDSESLSIAAPGMPPSDIDATMTASWGLDDLDTKVRPRAPEPTPPAGETVTLPPPVSSTPRPPVVTAAKPDEAPTTRRSETVLYTEASDEAVLVPTSEFDAPSSADSRGNTVIGQPPTRFRATPVAPRPAPAIVADKPAPTREVTPPPQAVPARGDTLVGPPPSEPSPTVVRGETVVPTPKRGDTLVGLPDPAVIRGETVVPTPKRGDTVVGPPPSEPSPTAVRGDTVVPTPRRGDTLVPETRRGDTLVPETRSEPTPIPRDDSLLPTDSGDREATGVVLEARGGFPLGRIAIAVVGLAALLTLAWSLGWLGGREPTPQIAASTVPTSKAAVAEPAKLAEPPRADVAAAKVATPPAKVEPAATPPSPPTPEATPPSPMPTPPVVPPTPDTPPPAPEPTPEPPAAEPPPDGAPPKIDAAIATALARALADRRLRVTESGLYVTAMREEATTWSAARALCDGLAIEGVDGWRLPHRRELVGIDVAGYLKPAPHWSRTSPRGDRESAYVLHPSTGQLTVWYKQESAAVVCVRAR